MMLAVDLPVIWAHIAHLSLLVLAQSSITWRVLALPVLPPARSAVSNAADGTQADKPFADRIAGAIEVDRVRGLEAVG